MKKTYSQQLAFRIETVPDDLKPPHNITGRPMTGWVIEKPSGIESDEELREWVH